MTAKRQPPPAKKPGQKGRRPPPPPPGYSTTGGPAHPKPKRHPGPPPPPPPPPGYSNRGGPKGPPGKRGPKRGAARLTSVDGWWIPGRNDYEPTCVATAIANSLLCQTGIRASEEAVLKLHRHAGGGDGVSIADALASVMQSGLAGVRPAGYWVTRLPLCGAIVGITDGTDDHAATYTPQGLISWGAPLAGDSWLADGEIWNIDWLGGGE